MCVSLILRVESENWGLKGPGDWEKTIWHIHINGSYICKSYYMPDWDKKDKTAIKKTGHLSESDIMAIKELIMRTWPETHDDAYDGTGWKFIAYDNEGKITKETEYGYIYGVDVLEHLIRLLPNDK